MQEKVASVPEAVSAKPDDDVSPDSQERIQEFLSRHGGLASRPARGEKDAFGECGWSEVYAADGYTLRCDWSRIGNRMEMKFSEIAPRSTGEQARNSGD